MAYDERVANRIREALAKQPLVEEKILFQGLAFMVEDKMCICVRNDVLLCRIGPDEYEAALEINGVEPMVHNGRSMKGYVFVSPEGYAARGAFESWVAKCLSFNKLAKSSKKKK
ncbi:TfoX/Sxy family transcriptional regulator of competence genes [Dyadobacter sp. BE34]|uniref:TfoX/Sxy family transcriptional regulator of competence genes n=1 Tax=Dyadobacter fermentans TaxID=94254 RepID=A0ABU1R735_9BACT|nr:MULTISPECIES: TfoX/Sxy family protein [Dyadobacter]MDR6809183.1 TfoX/Sxy family transcriptional regulator of competence genes [Dyadobacter fermentans]MDR7046926.1 TfoX/Sxy family transcriptional regulator of competence genes [Dyadobacter sp. BE242]MDR7201240.1 TfoX/Sxy family transcriptional regulator of competence genes [Dyadobacter sp. BE34]MDR7219200.1 TfoX/Sxy family transcriptional regulator of competence genes [Dyadobacter sp. BE31]MDR7264590.1 TfoX/Sxy family transcriptional regulato